MQILNLSCVTFSQTTCHKEDIPSLQSIREGWIWRGECYFVIKSNYRLTYLLSSENMTRLFLDYLIAGLCMSKQDQWENVCNEKAREEEDKEKERRGHGIK